MIMLILRSDTTPFCFSAATTQGRLLFQDGIYFIGKPADNNNS